MVCLRLIVSFLFKISLLCGVKKQNHFGINAASVLCLVTVVALFLPRIARAADTGDVIINELMHNPGTGNQLDEFLELYNTTDDDINLA